MSSNIPNEPEYVGQVAPDPAAKKGRTKFVVLGGAAAVSVAVIGAGAWGVSQLLGGGPGAAEVLPSNVLAYASIDLDPSAGQKIEAFQTMRKFPALEERIAPGGKDDLRRWLVEEVTGAGECEGLDYERDLEPWLGEKAAIAAVPNEDTVADPLIAIQVTDEGKAEAGIAKIFETCGDEEYGIAFLDGYALVAEKESTAKAAATAAEESSLADNAAFTDTLESVGDQGIATFYLAKEAPKALAEGLGDVIDDVVGGDAGGAPESDELAELYEDFKGAAGTVRFADGGIELAFAGTGVPIMDKAGSGGNLITSLPDTTIAALGFTLSEGWADGLMTMAEDAAGAELFGEMLSDIEAETGIRLPEDLEALLGDGAAIALDGGTDFEAAVEDPEAVKAGILVSGEEADVRRIISSLLNLGASIMGGPPTSPDEPNPFDEIIRVAADDDNVAIGFNDDYLADLLEDGELGSNASFTKAVAEADKAKVAIFVDFDAAGNWLDELVGDITNDDDEVLDNVKPLDALGISGWQDGDVSQFVLRLSTD